MRVLLLSTYDSITPTPTIPLALLYLKVALENSNIKTEIIDICYEDDRETLIKNKVRDFRPDIIGLSIKYQSFEGSRTGTNQEEIVINFVNYIRNVSKAVIVLGGAGFSGAPEYFLNLTEAKYGILGEGEVSLVDFAMTIDQGKEPSQNPIGGLIWKNEDGTFGYKPKGKYADISKYPLPDRTEINSRYVDFKSFIPINGIQTCRGCSFKCIFCNIKNSEGDIERTDSPEKVILQIKADEAKGFQGFYIADTIFNRPVKHAHDICDALIENNIKGPWSTTCTPVGFSRELAKKMKATGCNLITFGIDTADKTLLKKWKKGFNIDSIVDSVNICKEMEIISIVTLCIGGPEETIETLNNTFDVIDSVNPDILLTYYGFRIYGGTELAEIALREGMIKSLNEPYHNVLFYESPDLTQQQFKTFYKQRYSKLNRINIKQEDREAISWYAPRANDIAKVMFGKA